MTGRDAPQENISESAGHVWPDWYRELKTYRHADRWRSLGQLLNTLLPYAGLWYLMIRSIQRGYPYPVTLVLALAAAPFLVRIFILFHDCVHGSFFSSTRANTFFGYLLGVLVFTSLEDWRFSHFRHHVTYANLDGRGFGDIWTLTVREYAAASRKTRLQYRLYRHPLVLVGLGALFNFFLSNRLPTRGVKRREWMSILFTNLLILALLLAANALIGWRTFLAIQLPVLGFAGAAGIWLFYVQHQFKGGYWARKGDWDPLRAAMEGSSYYRLPGLLRWFSGNVGYHHVHHLNPRIPNYQLRRCHEAIPALRTKPPLTVAQSLSCFGLKLWDERQQQMVGFP